MFEAVGSYNKAIKLNSRLAVAHRALGHTALARHQFEKARISFENYRESAPDDTTIWFDIGRSYTMQNRDKQAMVAFKKTIKFHPKHSKALVEIGDILARKGKDKEARGYYGRAAKGQKDYGEAWCNYGISTGQQSSKLSSEAKKALRKCLSPQERTG